jgi:hypothetical protein
LRREVRRWRVEGGGWRVEGGGWRVEGGRRAGEQRMEKNVEKKNKPISLSACFVLCSITSNLLSRNSLLKLFTTLHPRIYT